LLFLAPVDEPDADEQEDNEEGNKDEVEV